MLEMEDQVKRLRPSNSNIWLNCTGYTNHSIEHTSNVFAIEGTVAHKIAETKLYSILNNFKEGITSIDNLFPEDSIEGKWIKDNNFSIKNEMETHINNYVYYIVDIYCDLYKKSNENIKKYNIPVISDVEIEFEDRDLGISGTCDFFIYGNNELHIVDFKYGKGTVLAQNNTQMMIYAILAINMYLDRDLNEVEKIILHIYQPRAVSSKWELSYKELLDFETQLEKTINNIKNDKIEYVMGKHCMYCEVKDQCPNIRSLVDKCMTKDFDYIEKVALHRKIIKQFIKECENKIIEDFNNDKRDYPLLKLVQGKKIRKYREGTENQVISILARNLPSEINIMKPLEPISPANAEKLLGKKKYEDLILDYVVNYRGSPSLVARNDEGEDIVRIEDDPLEVFDKIN